MPDPARTVPPTPRPGSGLRASLWLLLAGYYAAVVLLHDVVQQLLLRLFARWSFWGYELRLVTAWYVLAVPLAAWVGVAAWRKDGWRGAARWGGLVAIMSLADRFLLATQSERIHYPQYALLAVGLRLLTGAPGLSLALTTALGVGDEAYQALVLYRDRPDLPLDFKDMLLNLIGAAAGLLALEALVRRGRDDPEGTMREIQVAAAVIIREGRLLAARRPPGATRGGLWELPGGKVEPGESLPACLARELEEELSVKVRVIRPLISVTHDYPDLRIHLHAFICQCCAGTLTALEHDELRWLSPEELESVTWSPADRPVVRRLRRDLAGLRGPEPAMR